MSDRRSEHLEPDAELESRLRDAFARLDPPGAPDSLRVTAEHLANRPDERRGLGGWFRLVPMAMATVAIVVSVAFIGALLSPVDPSTTKGDDVPAVSPGMCPVSRPAADGSIGGPRAFFARDSLPPSGASPWRVVVRFAPDIDRDDDVTLTARELDAIADSPGDYVGPIDRSDPRERGGLHLFTQPIPNPGCWELIAIVNGDPAGSAVVQIGATDQSGAPTP